jgi:CRISPR/Cas system Type II protein with McrA/HNH and RuvC-like nuclease domain
MDEWIFKGYLYRIDSKHNYNDEEVELLILDEYDKDRKRFERLKQKYGSLPDDETSYSRPRIPENVRIEVWRRDDGKCARCGGRENLEYDHIVPISKGGSNTARNIELLCEKCNRSKSNNVV